MEIYDDVKIKAILRIPIFNIFKSQFLNLYFLAISKQLKHIESKTWIVYLQYIYCFFGHIWPK